ncbi:MAG: hypothetical protein K8U57_00495, partial [Planctomycetes bacterium]|nr:hypothetical protein [Planctomycetota bacterium]
MGYTHFASRRKRLPLREFKTAAADCQKVVEALWSEKGIRIQFDRDDPKPAHFGDDSVQFNGVGDDAHETFAVERDYRVESWNCDPKRGEGWFEFTKTARKPYDCAVCACLIVFQHHFGKSYSVSSDGSDDDEGWVAAREWCQRVLGYGADFSLKVPPKMTVLGLVFASPWYTASGDSVRDLSNGWRLMRAKKAAFRWMVYDPKSWDAGFLTGGNTIRTARWNATVTFFQTEFTDA